MLIPLRDHNPTRHFPIVTVSLIAINVAVFALINLRGDQAAHLAYSMVPAEIAGKVEKTIPAPPPMVSIFTSMFLHGGWMHIIFNMWTLWIFGNNLEDALGRGKYLALYVFWGYLAAWSHIAFNWDSVIPTVGASGAIAGVMGAYLVLFPHARIDCMLTFFVITFVEVPAIFFLIFWITLQFFQGNPGVAYLAHIGGFVAGWITMKLMGGQRILGHRIHYDHDD